MPFREKHRVLSKVGRFVDDAATSTAQFARVMFRLSL